MRAFVHIIISPGPIYRKCVSTPISTHFALEPRPSRLPRRFFHSRGKNLCKRNLCGRPVFEAIFPALAAFPSQNALQPWILHPVSYYTQLLRKERLRQLDDKPAVQPGTQKRAKSAIQRAVAYRFLTSTVERFAHQSRHTVSLGYAVQPQSSTRLAIYDQAAIYEYSSGMRELYS